MKSEIVIIGAGAHALKLWIYAELIGVAVKAFVDDNPQAVSPSPDVPCLPAKDVGNIAAG